MVRKTKEQPSIHSECITCGSLEHRLRDCPKLIPGQPLSPTTLQKRDEIWARRERQRQEGTLVENIGVAKKYRVKAQNPKLNSTKTTITHSTNLSNTMMASNVDQNSKFPPSNNHTTPGNMNNDYNINTVSNPSNLIVGSAPSPSAYMNHEYAGNTGANDANAIAAGVSGSSSNMSQEQAFSPNSNPSARTATGNGSVSFNQFIMPTQASRPYLPSQLAEPAVIMRMFAFRPMPAAPRVMEYNNSQTFIDDNYYWSKHMEEWIEGFQAYMIQLKQLSKIQAIIPSKMIFSWNMHHDGLKMQFPLQYTAQTQHMLDNAIMRANQIIQSQENQRQLASVSGPGFGLQANPVPDFVQPPSPLDSSPPGVNNGVGPHASTAFGVNDEARAEREKAQAVSPTQATTRGRARAGAGSGSRRVSLSLSSTTGKSLTDRLQVGAAARGKGAAKDTTTPTPRKRVNKRKATGDEVEDDAQGGDMGTTEGGDGGTGDGKATPKTKTPRKRAPPKAKKLKVEVEEAEVTEAAGDLDAHHDNAGEGLD